MTPPDISFVMGIFERIEQDEIDRLDLRADEADVEPHEIDPKELRLLVARVTSTPSSALHAPAGHAGPLLLICELASGVHEGERAAYCALCCEGFWPLRNHGGACFGHHAEKRDYVEIGDSLSRRGVVYRHGSVSTLDCCGKYFGSSCLDTPEPYPAMQYCDLLQGDGAIGECFHGICAASLRRGIVSGPHRTEGVDEPDEPVRAQRGRGVRLEGLPVYR